MDTPYGGGMTYAFYHWIYVDTLITMYVLDWEMDEH